MREILYQYEINPTTWVYLSSLLMLVVFFKFGRLFSLRNLDLLALIALAPGLLLVSQGQQLRAADPTATEMSSAESWGYVWLLSVGGFFLVRLIADPLIVRRPLLEPNLSAGGLGFLAVCLFVFLMGNVVTYTINPSPAVSISAGSAGAGDERGPPHNEPSDGPESDAFQTPVAFLAAGLDATDSEAPALRDDPLEDEANAQPAEGPVTVVPSDPLEAELPSAASRPPGFLILDWFPRIPTRAFGVDGTQARRVTDVTTRTLLVLSHFALVAGLVFIGARHFDNAWTGMAMATLYLMLPYTAQMVGRVDHVVPAALLVWTLALYNRPLAAGVLMGLNVGLIYYAGFMLPLWGAFYFRRGLVKFIVGIVAAMSLLFVLIAVFDIGNLGMFLGHFAEMFDMSLDTAEGFWATHPAYFRLPLAVVFCCLCTWFAVWPAKKNLGTLMSCSAAVMLGTQFWYAHGGLLYVNWYLPALLLTVFRPNLEHRVAISTYGNGRRATRRRPAAPQAA